MSIKQKQVLGVTSIVALVVVGLSAQHLAGLARVLLEESRARSELLTEIIYHRVNEAVTTQDAAYETLRTDGGVRSVLESAIYSPNVTYAAIVDPRGVIIAHTDPARSGERLQPGGDLAALVDAGPWTQLGAVFTTGRTLEWRQPIEIDGEPFAEIRIGVSTLLIADELTESLRPSVVAALIALAIATGVAMLLSQIVLRPIHVIRSGLSRLGGGDLGATLDLKDEEFKDLGDVFASLSAQLKAVAPDGAKRQLVELSKRVAALGRLTAGVAHEVKNPLNAMTIHLELLKQKLAAGAPATATANHVEVIGREIRRLDDVVQGFLKFARPEELSLQPVRPDALVAEVLKTIEPEAQACKVTLDQSSLPDLPPVDADAVMLRQALLNLAKNAIQAMPGGGRLTVTCGRDADGRVSVRVADSGVGIPPENLERIFDLYFTTKEEGTGIGLSLVYRTVQLHNGDIDVESMPGRGTTFVIKLPASASTALRLGR